MLSRHPLIFNPSSGGGISKKVSQFYIENAADLAIFGSKSEKDYLDLIGHFISENEEVIIVSGGDGTINKGLRSFIKSGIALGIFPMGTMNVFARELGISTTNFNKMLSVIKERHVVEVDVFTVNGQPFAQMAGIGYDAHIIEETSEQNKMKLGPLAYALPIAKVLGDKPPLMKVETAEGVQIEGVCVLVGNGKLYGGHIPLFSHASNTDGLVDLIIIKSNGYLAALDLALNVINEETLALNKISDKIDYIQTSSVKITSDIDAPFELDGEYYGRAKEFIIKKEEKPLRVIASKEGLTNEWSEKLSALWSLTPLS